MLCAVSPFYFEIKKKKWFIILTLPRISIGNNFGIYLLGTKNCFLMDMEESLFFLFKQRTKHKTQNTKNAKVGNVNRFKNNGYFPKSKFCTTKVVMMQVTSSLLFVSAMFLTFFFFLLSLLSCPPQLLDSTPSL